MKTNVMRNNICIILISLIFIFGCSSSQNTSNKNVSGIYLPGLNLIDPAYEVFHENDTLTTFYFRFRSDNILYTKKHNDTTFSANILIQYELTDQSLKSIVDSASIHFIDYRPKNSRTKKYLDGKINLPTELNNIYRLTVTFNDANRDQYIKKQIVIDRSNVYNNQNFLLIDSVDNVIFSNHFNVNEQVFIKKK